MQTLRAKNQHNTGNSSKHNQRNAKKIKILQLAFDKCHDLVINAKERRFIKLKSKTFNFISFLVNFNLVLSKLALSKMQTWNIYHPFPREVPFSNYWTFNLFVLSRFRHVGQKNSDEKQVLGQSAKLSKTKQPFFVFLSFQKGPKFKKKFQYQIGPKLSEWCQPSKLVTPWSPGPQSPRTTWEPRPTYCKQERLHMPEHEKRNISVKLYVQTMSFVRCKTPKKTLNLMH